MKVLLKASICLSKYNKDCKASMVMMVTSKYNIKYDIKDSSNLCLFILAGTNCLLGILSQFLNNIILRIIR